MIEVGSHQSADVSGAVADRLFATPQVEELIESLMSFAGDAGVRLNMVERGGTRFSSCDEKDREAGVHYVKLAHTKNICAVNVVYDFVPPSIDLYMHPRTAKLIASWRRDLPMSLSGIEYGVRRPIVKWLEAPTADQFVKYAGEGLWDRPYCVIFREGRLWKDPVSLDHFCDRLRMLASDRFAELRIDFKLGTQNLQLHRTRASGLEDRIFVHSVRGRLGANGSWNAKNPKSDRDDFFDAEYNNFEHAARDVAKRLFGRNDA